MMNIFDILFEIFPHLILGAGPFCVFKGMGTGKDSGKLLFKKIYSDGGLSITESSMILDLSVSGGGTPDPIDTCEIAFGTGVGITSSVFYVDDVSGRCALLGISNISTYLSNNRNFSGETKDYGTLVIGGYSNKIYDPYSENSLIVGGYQSQLANYGPSLTSKQSVIIGSRLSYMRGYSEIIENNFISSQNSKIIGHSNNFLSGANSSIKFGRNSSLSSINKTSCLANSCRSQVIEGGIINNGQGHSIQNGLGNTVYYGKYNSVQNGNSNLITLEVSNQTNKYTYYSSIVNGQSNELRSGFGNTILTGKNNKIVSYNYSAPNSYKYPANYSTILTGRLNCITIGPNSAILNGYQNEIFVSNYLSPASPGDVNYSANNVIMSGKNNKINWGSNNVSIYGDGGSINRSFRSKTSEGSNFISNGATNSNNNIIGGSGCLNRVSNSVLLSGVSEANSRILGSFSNSTVYTSSSNILSGSGLIQGTCDHNNNILFNFTSCNSQIKYSNRSTIIGGQDNCIIANGTGSVTSTVIMNSFGSKAIATNGCRIVDSVIISGTSSGLTQSYRSAIISSFQSRIEGGCLNSIINSSNSIIGREYKGPGNRRENCMVSIISSNDSRFCIPDAGMDSMLNSVIIGLTGSCTRGSSNFTVVGNLHILGTVSVSDGTNKIDGVWFCQKPLSTITQLVVCNGIVTSIT